MALLRWPPTTEYVICCCLLADGGGSQHTGESCFFFLFFFYLVYVTEYISSWMPPHTHTHTAQRLSAREISQTPWKKKKMASLSLVYNGPFVLLFAQKQLLIFLLLLRHDYAIYHKKPLFFLVMWCISMSRVFPLSQDLYRLRAFYWCWRLFAAHNHSDLYCT